MGLLLTQKVPEVNDSILSVFHKLRFRLIANVLSSKKKESDKYAIHERTVAHSQFLPHETTPHKQSASLHPHLLYSLLALPAVRVRTTFQPDELGNVADS